MRKIREMLRLRAQGHSKRAISLSLKISDSTVRRYLDPVPHIRGQRPAEARRRGPVRGLVMAYKLLRMAEERWRRLDGFQLLPLVRAGVEFVDGEQVEREDTQEQRREAA